MRVWSMGHGDLEYGIREVGVFGLIRGCSVQYDGTGQMDTSYVCRVGVA
jgi:hypothetical protein